MLDETEEKIKRSTLIIEKIIRYYYLIRNCLLAAIEAIKLEYALFKEDKE